MILFIVRPTASNSLSEALVSRHTNARSLLVDMLDREQVGRLVEEADIVIRCVDSGMYVTSPIK